MAAAQSMAPQSQAASRAGMRSMPRPLTSASDQASTGSSDTTPERPKNCISTSAKAAPPKPRILVGSLPVA